MPELQKNYTHRGSSKGSGNAFNIISDIIISESIDNPNEFNNYLFY